MATRGVGRLVTAAALAGTGVFGFAASAGAASGGDSVMIDNAPSLTIYSGQLLSLASIAKATCRVGLTSRSVSLSLAGPIGPTPTTQTVKSDNVPCNRDAALATSISAPKLNGAYTVTLENSTPANLTTATLDVLIPPARAKGFSASTAGTIASFSWSANPEPDVVAYQILTSSGNVATAPTASEACGGSSTCSSTLDLGPSAAGKTEKFSVRAVRCGLACSDSTVPGASSASATASFSDSPPPPPAPTTSPTPTPIHSSGGGGGEHGGSSGTGGGGGNSRGASSSSSHHKVTAHVPSATRSHLPSIHVPALGGLQTLAKPVVGKPGGKIHYPSPQVARIKPAQSTSSTRTISHDIATGLTLPPLWRGIAAASILLLIAMHLRTWAARVELS